MAPYYASSLVPANQSGYGGGHAYRRMPTLALDCEMVGVGENGRLSILARASLVDERGNTVYDVLVRPEKHVTDYRTHLTGLRRGDLDKGKVFQYVCPITVKCTGVNFYTVRTHVLKLIDGCRLVGHSLHSDLQVLRIAHPPHLTFDTAQCRRLRALAQVDARKAPGLRVLTERLLRRRIQNGAHDSVEDALATMHLYQVSMRTPDSVLTQRYAVIQR